MSRIPCITSVIGMFCNLCLHTFSNSCSQISSLILYFHISWHCVMNANGFILIILCKLVLYFESYFFLIMITQLICKFDRFFHLNWWEFHIDQGVQKSRPFIRPVFLKVGLCASKQFSIYFVKAKMVIFPSCFYLCFTSEFPLQMCKPIHWLAKGNTFACIVRVTFCRS